MLQTEIQSPPVSSVQPVEETVGQCSLYGNSPLQKYRSHHGYISKRKQKCTDDTKYQRLGHRDKILAFNTAQSQNREKDN